MAESEVRVESAETEGAPEAEIAPGTSPVRRWTSARLPPQGRNRIAWGVAFALFGWLAIAVTTQYLRLARMSDHLLAEGPFSSSTNILAAPETIATGDAITPEGLAGKLERAGYTGSPRAAGKSYEVQARAVQIDPGADSSRDRAASAR